MYPTFIKNVKGVLKSKKRSILTKKAIILMRKYRLYRFSYVIIPRTDIPILNNKIILLKTRKPAVIIHIRQSPEKKD